MKLTFFGGAESATGSIFFLETSAGSVMIDCGLFQGSPEKDALNHKPFLFEPARIDAVFATHAHIDHIGRIPKLFKDGYHGPVYSTRETKQMAELMLRDTAHLMTSAHERGGPEPIYGFKDVDTALAAWRDVSYHETVHVKKGLIGTLLDAGHILGSAMVKVSVGGKNVVFSGDLGNSPAPILKDTEAVTDADYLVTESVYGDREHESTQKRREKLEDVIESTINDRGVLLIPAFSIERTQTLLYELNLLVEAGKIPSIPVFLDSPLAIKITNIYKAGTLSFNDVTKNIIAKGDDIFNFPKLTFTDSVAKSKAIDETPNPKIIIAGSGMSTGGRVLNHEKRYLPDPTTTFLAVGYQAPGTVGRRILDGERTVAIDGADVNVRAKIRAIFGYSAHKDSEGIIDFVKGSVPRLKRVFVVLGEPKASHHLAQRLRDFLGVDAIVPRLNESFPLD